MKLILELSPCLTAVWSGGVIPFVYRKVHKDRVNKKGHSVYNLEIYEVEIIRQLFYMTVNEGLGTHRLAEWVNAQKIRNHNGSKWQFNTVYRILKNPIYTGYLVTKTARSKNQIVESAVIEILKNIFCSIKTTSEDEFLESKYLQQTKAGKERIRKYDNIIEKLQKEMKVLKDEIINTLTGTGKFSSEILNELISQKELEIKTLIQEKETVKIRNG